MSSLNYKDKGKIIKFGGGTLVVRKIEDDATPYSSAITSITKASTAVVTTVDDLGLIAGDVVLIHSATGMTQINGLLFTVANPNDEVIELSGVDSQAYGVYSGGGILEIANVYNLGYINDTGFKFTTDTEDIKDEVGQVVQSLEVSDTVTCEGIFMQTGKDLIEFLRDNTGGTFYQIYYKSSPTGQMNGLTQELFGALVRIQPLIDVKANIKRIPFKMTLLNNDDAVTITSPHTVFGSVRVTDVTVVADTYFTITET